MGKNKSKASKGKSTKVHADYSSECDVCGASPVVSITGMCGPCTFGEAACADPAEWEGEYKEVEPARQ